MRFYDSNTTTTATVFASPFASVRFTFRVGPPPDDAPPFVGSRRPQPPPFEPGGEVIEAEYTVGRKETILAAEGKAE